MGFLQAVRHEVWQTVQRPERITRIARPAHVSNLAFRLRRGEPPMVDGRRRYRSYEHYVAHQRSKLGLLDLSGYDIRFHDALVDRLRSLEIDWSDRSVLCLAARMGTEVRAFATVGAFAVGIDLNPGRANPRVLHGDFHDLQFADGCVGAVYCNSLDHALEIERTVAEVHRVLRPGGLALIEAVYGTEEGTEFGPWEVRSWEHADEVAQAFTSSGFTLRSHDDFEVPWSGRRFVLERTP